MISLKLNAENLFKFHKKCTLYLLKIENKELLCNFYETIKYSIQTLNELHQQRDLIDFNKELDKVSEVFKEIYLYCKDIDEACISAKS